MRVKDIKALNLYHCFLIQIHIHPRRIEKITFKILQIKTVTECLFDEENLLKITLIK